MASEFVCPKCEATLRTAKPLAPGKRVKCPHCSEVVTVPEKEMAVRSGKAAPAPAAAPLKEKSKRPRDEDEEDERPRRKRAEEDDDADEEDDDRPRSKKKKKAKSGGKGLMIGLIIGGVVLLLGGGGLALFFLLGSSNPLVGAWEGNQGPMQVRTEFTSGGRMTSRFTMTQQPPAIPGLPAMTIPPFSINGTYKIKGTMVEINVPEEEVNRAVEEMKQGLPPAIRGFVNPRQMGNMPRNSVEPFRREGDTLHLGGMQMRRAK